MGRQSHLNAVLLSQGLWVCQGLFIKESSQEKYHYREQFLVATEPQADYDMITIVFPDRETEKRALGFLLGRFSGRVLKSGEHIVPEAALEALANQNIPFTVRGKTTYEQQLAALRSSAPSPV